MIEGFVKGFNDTARGSSQLLGGLTGALLPWIIAGTVIVIFIAVLVLASDSDRRANK